eukprot:TRINITY_DN59935_c0_g1_i1.p1 TRINITY_DN59935_c0_g1~~TRINITY_DN59935_c0_g1_i1.p1  ORF type:complete len:306 (+),score=75.22 TRINITY_DN59935_c0_g1_i1:82-918(+)
MALVVQLSDLHVYGDAQAVLGSGLRPLETLRRVVARAREVAPAPAAVLLTGDFSQDDSRASYEHVVSVVSAAWDPAQVPIFYVPGNHEDLPVLTEVLQGKGFVGPRDRGSPCAGQIGGWDLLLLSTHVPGEVPGKLDPADVEWLRGQLQTGERPALVALHHPPLPPEPRTPANWWFDKCLCDPEPAIAALTAEGSRARVVCHGHCHSALSYDYPGGKCVQLCAPATCHQYDSTGSCPPEESPEMTVKVGFRLLTLQDDGSHETQVEWLPEDLLMQCAA